MKTLLNSLLLILTLMCSSAIAQNKSNYSIEGRVVEASSNNGIGYATVALLQGDSTVVAAVAADATGAFKISAKNKGSYTLQISSVGYTTLNRGAHQARQGALGAGC